MPDKDIFAKRVFEDETPKATAGRISYTLPPKTPVDTTEADGYLRLLAPQVSQRGTKLVAPWSLLEDTRHTEPEVILELKMAGDHTDKFSLKRALLQRAAREFYRYQYEEKKTPYRGDEPLWVVCGHLPHWVRSYYDQVEEVAEACYLLKGERFLLYWIASNQLPEREELIPFLVTREGKPLQDFIRWVSKKRPPDWVMLLMKVTKMPDSFVQDVLKLLPKPDDPQLKKQELLITRNYLERNPEVKDELKREGAFELLHSMARMRLGRALSVQESARLKELLAKDGQEPVLEALTTKNKTELAQYLAPPASNEPTKKTKTPKRKR